ncbi:MAG: cyclopropane-fatty-acyl-phospholipid synthase family protein [Phaeovulum sp.]|uniref:SAM-dependent methyltransferase n=1 Tax=Phaeovulum sp. TaxID=2934796 RepID=UPI002735F5EC|nr:cyclopropane-fatty-acyl-phospholipid synthase family protein [Phaeovulum sp.]MDP3861325.1 cyclopropane-fatty-acyl-phospholipid synthase family protein [Phaeovulum sp.]
MIYLSARVRREFLDALAGIRQGSLALSTPEGDALMFGSGEPAADLHITDWSVVTALAARGDIGLGETYVAGLWHTSSIEKLAQMALLNRDQLAGFSYADRWNQLRYRLADRVLRANSLRGAARNIRAHYDVGNAFYQLWLDPSMTYSSALFAPGDTDLYRGQLRKYDRILNRIGNAENVLEVGCGWGGFAERAAGEGRRVTGLTLSPAQKGYADARLDGRAEIRLQDYRSTEGRFDAIVSIEMIEAVGEAYWPAYFATLKARLAEGGRAVIQAITVPDAYFSIYRAGSDYIRRYTFPGGMLASTAVLVDQARRAGLEAATPFAFGGDYAETLRLWSARMSEAAPRIRRLGHDEAFLRSWKFYLEICAAAFATGHTDVLQLELQHA